MNNIVLLNLIISISLFFSCKLEVTTNTANPSPSITSVTISPTTGSIEVDSTITLLATVVTIDESAETVTWSSNDQNKATVNGGIVTGVAEGIVTITATSTVDASMQATAIVIVTDEPSITSVTISPTTGSIEVDSTITLLATVVTIDGSAETVTWSSNDQNKATVNGGIVTGVAEGIVTITATSTVDASMQATAIVIVTDDEPTFVFSGRMTSVVVPCDLSSMYQTVIGTSPNAIGNLSLSESGNFTWNLSLIDDEEGTLTECVELEAFSFDLRGTFGSVDDFEESALFFDAGGVDTASFVYRLSNNEDTLTLIYTEDTLEVYTFESLQ